METFDELRELEKLPLVVRTAVTSGDTWNTVADIGLRFQLHIDAIGSLANTVKRMLFGRINPTQLIGEMRAMGIDDARVNDIARALNEQIFKPLHQKMRGDGDVRHREPAPPQTPVPMPFGPPLQPASRPQVVPAQTSQPATERALPKSVFQPLSHPITPPAQIPQPLEHAPPSATRAYSSDPYREPIE